MNIIKPRRVALTQIPLPSQLQSQPIGSFSKIGPSTLGSRPRSKSKRKSTDDKIEKGLKNIRKKIKKGEEPSALELDILQKRIKKKQEERFKDLIKKFETIAKKEEAILIDTSKRSPKKRSPKKETKCTAEKPVRVTYCRKSTRHK